MARINRLEELKKQIHKLITDNNILIAEDERQEDNTARTDYNNLKGKWWVRLGLWIEDESFRIGTWIWIFSERVKRSWKNAFNKRNRKAEYH